MKIKKSNKIKIKDFETKIKRVNIKNKKWKIQ